MFLNVESLNLEQLVEKQIELRQKLAQAHGLGMAGPASQIENMLEQISIEIKTKSLQQKEDQIREKKIEEGKDPDDNDVLNIG
jgi:hypothetical protein